MSSPQEIISKCLYPVPQPNVSAHSQTAQADAQAAHIINTLSREGLRIVNTSKVYHAYKALKHCQAQVCKDHQAGIMDSAWEQEVADQELIFLNLLAGGV